MYQPLNRRKDKQDYINPNTCAAQLFTRCEKEFSNSCNILTAEYFLYSCVAPLEGSEYRELT